MSKGYEILALDDLGRYRYPSESDEGPLLMPLRRRLGLRAFGANCWTAPVGGPIVPRHDEQSGNEELYVVVRGRAAFTVGDEAIDAPAGTLVHVVAGTERQAIAEEPDTLVVAVGGTPGEPFTVYGWEDTIVAFTDARAGRVAEGRAIMETAASRRPGHWSGAYNLACYESLFGDHDAAFEQLRRSLAAAPAEAREQARGDPDLRPLHDDPRWQEVVG
jgi:hypothetical protein